MPPSAAPECERVGWSFEMIATSAPASCAAMAARIPAQPPPITSTSCSPITSDDASESGMPTASVLNRGAGGRDVGRRLRGELLLEVVAEHPGEVACFAVVRLAVAPRLTRRQELVLDAWHVHGHLESEEVVSTELRAVEGTGERRLDERARRRDRHTAPLAERAAGPAGVDEPHRRAVL